jgi:hypothetical protein
VGRGVASVGALVMVTSGAVTMAAPASAVDTEIGRTLPASATQSAVSYPGGGIAWNRAINHVGSRKRVCGPLAGIGSSSDDVFLNIGRDYPNPDRFTVVLWDVGGVKPIAVGTTVCVFGRISLYRGVAEIQLRSASDVKLYR